MSVEIEINDGVAVITMNRPERKNAFTREQYELLAGALNNADTNDEVRVVVLTGAGAAFSWKRRVLACTIKEVQHVKAGNTQRIYWLGSWLVRPWIVCLIHWLTAWYYTITALILQYYAFNLT